MFAVVEFSTSQGESTQELAVVPLSWLYKTERKCYWPDKVEGRFDNYVKTKPTPDKKWPSFNIFKIHCKKESYTDAESQLKEILKDNEHEVEHSDSTSVKSLSRKDPIVDNNNYESFTSSTSTVTVHSPEFENVMLEQVSKLSSHIEQQTIMLAEILRKTRESQEAVNIPENVPKFPLTNLTDFLQFDQQLSENNDLKQYLVCQLFNFNEHGVVISTLYKICDLLPKISRLAAVGGSGVDSLVRRIMRFLITDEVAVSYNWKGREKLPFEKTHIVLIIYESAKKNFPEKEKNDFCVANTVKDWLKYANTRLKSMKARASCK